MGPRALCPLRPDAPSRRRQGPGRRRLLLTRLIFSGPQAPRRGGSSRCGPAEPGSAFIWFSAGPAPEPPRASGRGPLIIAAAAAGGLARRTAGRARRGRGGGRPVHVRRAGAASGKSSPAGASGAPDTPAAGMRPPLPPSFPWPRVNMAAQRWRLFSSF